MLELIIVIVVIGILAAMAVPRFQRDNLQEVTEQILKDIRYTQHLAMTDDVYDATTNNWYLARWQIQFLACGAYRVYSDTNKGGACDVNEAAVDPYTGLLLYSNGTCNRNIARDSENIFLADRYDVTALNFTGGCNGVQSIGFDTFGRPYSSVNTAASSTGNLMQQDCNVTITVSGNDSVVITIEKETGYARVTKWN